MTIARPSQQGTDVVSIFISYNRNDSDNARQLARQLEKRGARAWLDKLNLAPGARWHTEIAGALGHASAVAVLIGPSGLGGWQELELQLAMAKQSEHAQRIIPIPLPGAPRAPTLPELLAPFMHCDLRAQNRAKQVDRLVEALATEQKQELDTEPADWLIRLFQSAGKIPPRRERTSQIVRAQPDARQPAGARRLFSAEDADELLQNLGSVAPPAENPTLEVTQELEIVPSRRERSS